MRNVLSRMIADSDCPKCGGPVGSHSDMCLECGYDTDSWENDPMIRNILSAAALILIGFCFGMCTEVKRTRHYTYTKNEANEVVQIAVTSETLSLGFKGIHDYATFDQGEGTGSAVPVIKANPF